MSVKQVKAISIIGMMSELEKVVKFCGDSQMFHPDDAMSFYSDTQSFVPLHHKNPYSARIQELKNAAELAGRLRGMQCHVNVIPLNTVAENAIQGVNEAVVTRFMQELEKRHISVTRRREMGDDIDGACGQLRRNTMKYIKADE